MIDGVAVRPDDDEVLDVRAIDLNPPMHHIVKRSHARWNLEANRPWRVRRFEFSNLLRGQIQAATVVLPGLPARLGALPFLSQPVGGAVAVVRAAGGDERCGCRAMT